jgi:hypothetical protein
MARLTPVGVGPPGRWPGGGSGRRPSKPRPGCRRIAGRWLRRSPPRPCGRWKDRGGRRDRSPSDDSSPGRALGRPGPCAGPTTPSCASGRGGWPGRCSRGQREEARTHCGSVDPGSVAKRKSRTSAAGGRNHPARPGLPGSAGPRGAASGSRSDSGGATREVPPQGCSGIRASGVAKPPNGRGSSHRAPADAAVRPVCHGSRPGPGGRDRPGDERDCRAPYRP